jgi:hypothetical protein
VFPVLVVNPRSDLEFTRFVFELAGGAELTSSELEQHVRKSYPRAVVRERDLSSEDQPTWYIYREGRWIPHD